MLAAVHGCDGRRLHGDAERAARQRQQHRGLPRSPELGRQPVYLQLPQHGVPTRVPQAAAGQVPGHGRRQLAHVGILQRERRRGAGGATCGRREVRQRVRRRREDGESSGDGTVGRRRLETLPPGRLHLDDVTLWNISFMDPRIKMIVALNLLWSEFAETNERPFDLLLQIFT